MNRYNVVLCFSLIADHFIISKLMGYCADGSIKCNASVATLYKNLMNDFKIEHTSWKEIFTGRTNICSPSNNSTDIEDFLDNVEERVININLVLRRELNIPMPMIYKDGKELDEEVCDKYINDIEEFIHNVPNSSINMPIAISTKGTQYHRITFKE